MQPIIALTTYGRYEKDLSTAWYQDHFSLPALYVDAVRRAGGVPLMLPPGANYIAALLASVDGVIVTGGADIHPASYGGNMQHPQLTLLDTERDKFELTLVRHLIANEKVPTLCICRGMQILNVALGGSLHEHVADNLPKDIHRGEDGGWTLHEVSIKPASLLAAVTQDTTVVAYSGHHQAIKNIASDLLVSAVASDGVIEAVEHTDLPWMLGVQWHPEITAAEDPAQQRLFDVLVQEAAKNKSRI